MLGEPKRAVTQTQNPVKMSILVQENGGGGGGSNPGTNGASVALPNSDLTPAVDVEEERYDSRWRQCLEQLSQKTVVYSCKCSSAQIEPATQVPNEPGLLSIAEAHGEHIFPVKCGCQNCLDLREMVIHLYHEDCHYNSLWERLQLLMKRYYDLIPE